MLYTTTRSNQETYTAFRAITSDRAPDGGFFLPLRMHKFTAEQWEIWAENSFEKTVADVLNLLFSAKLTQKDIADSAGRSGVRLIPMNHKLLMAELWHNDQGNLDLLCDKLAARILGREAGSFQTGVWMGIAVRIALLFGIYLELMRGNIVSAEMPADLSVAAGDFTAPMAAWYARDMGLPIGTIICAFNDNSAAWDLFNHGQLRTNEPVIATDTPEADMSYPPQVERLICQTLGREQVSMFAKSCDSGKQYDIPADLLNTFRAGVFAAVVSQSRMRSTRERLFRSSGYAMSPYTALAYAGLQDFRAMVGETRPAIILAEKKFE